MQGCVQTLCRGSSSQCSLLMDFSAAGRQQIRGALACQCGTTLGSLLELVEVSGRMPVKERVRGMRYVYTLLLWTAERIAEVRA